MNLYDRNEINFDNNSGILQGPPTSSGDCLYVFEIYSWTTTDPNCTSPGPATFEFESASTGQTYTHTINLTGVKNIFLPKDDTYYLWIYDDGSGDCINARINWRLKEAVIWGGQTLYSDTNVLLDYNRAYLKPTGGRIKLNTEIVVQYRWMSIHTELNYNVK